MILVFRLRLLRKSFLCSFSHVSSWLDTTYIPYTTSHHSRYNSIGERFHFTSRKKNSKLPPQPIRTTSSYTLRHMLKFLCMYFHFHHSIYIEVESLFFPLIFFLFVFVFVISYVLFSFIQTPLDVYKCASMYLLVFSLWYRLFSYSTWIFQCRYYQCKVSLYVYIYVLSFLSFFSSSFLSSSYFPFSISSHKDLFI